MKHRTRNIIVAGVVSVAATISLTLWAVSNHASGGGPDPHEGGHWIGTQLGYAQGVMENPPVSESAGLARCVVSHISNQVSFSDFVQYANLVEADDFSNPSQTALHVIAFLQEDALSCPEGS